MTTLTTAELTAVSYTLKVFVSITGVVIFFRIVARFLRSFLRV